MPESPALDADSIRLFPVTAPLAVTQIVGWGTTYWMPALLAEPLKRDIGLTPEIAFGGITVMLMVSASVGPRCGRLIDRYGSRWPMVAGSLMFAVALTLMAFATGPKSYLASWIFIGLGTPIALTQAAAAALAQRTGSKARQAIGLLMLMGGLSTTVFWPLAAVIEGAVGWRGVCLAFAAINLMVCAPIHAIFVRGARAPDGAALAAKRAENAPLSTAERRSAFVLMVTAFSLTGFITWGLPLQMVEIVKAAGHPVAFAVFVGSLMGPAQVMARLAEMTFGRSLGILTVGVISVALLPLTILLPLLGPATQGVAIGFVIGYGMAAGAMTIVRSVAPLSLFGREAYATMIGWLGLPQNIVFALSPMAFAFVMRQWGTNAALVMALAAALAALAAMLVLHRRFAGRIGA